MNSKTLKYFLFMLVWGGSCNVWAWNYTAHHVIASIAYQHLSPKARQHTQQLLQPLSAYYHDQFVTSASWADRITFHDVAAFSSWHYIDKAIVRDNVSAEQPKAQNVVWAIKQAETVLASCRSNVFEKALFLRFLLHFIGDVHQPLHCASLYSAKFPKGDRGGNVFPVHWHGKPTNLHQVWDAGGGLTVLTQSETETYLAQVKHLASNLQAKYPLNLFQEKVATEPAQWAADSYQLALRAYDVTIHQTLSSAYLSEVRTVSAQQIVLAGYRLARRLNNLFNQDCSNAT